MIHYARGATSRGTGHVSERADWPAGTADIGAIPPNRILTPSKTVCPGSGRSNLPPILTRTTSAGPAGRLPLSGLRRSLRSRPDAGPRTALLRSRTAGSRNGAGSRIRAAMIWAATCRTARRAFRSSRSPCSTRRLSSRATRSPRPSTTTAGGRATTSRAAAAAGW